MIVLRVVRGVSEHFLIRFVEWMNAAILFNFGLTLLRQPQTFATAHLYDTMAMLGSEREWGGTMLGIALVRIVALMLNGTFNWFNRLSPWTRVATAYLSAGVWFAVAISLLWVGTSPPGIGTYGVLMVSDIVFAGIIAREATRVHVGSRDGHTGYS
jgi:hypothetical protein